MWKNILANPEDKKYEHTLREILQQPSCWRKTVDIIFQDQKLQEFIKNALSDETRPILVSGAGSSEFAGQSILDTLCSSFNRRVIHAPTTDIVTSPKKYGIPNAPALMISFARSGNSPESVAAVKLIKQVSPTTKHLIITCNKDGSLAKNTQTDVNDYSILLPEETNDVSLVMTSSFSSMVLAAVLCSTFNYQDSVRVLLEKACEYTEIVFTKYADHIHQIIAPSHINRVQYLGTSDAKGLLTEGHLKMLEMTDGKIATRVDSYLGLRHGPQVFVDSNTVVIAVLSENSYIRQYEFDLLKEMKQKKQGYAYIVIGKDADSVELPNLLPINTQHLGEFYRLFPALATVQLLGFFKSLALGLSPDAPSISGTINRVVEGVNIYPFSN